MVYINIRVSRCKPNYNTQKLLLHFHTMELTTVLVLASVVAIVQLFFRYSSTPSKHGYLQWIPRSSRTEAPEKYTREFKTLHGEHEVEKVLNDLVREDGAGSWPPVANHTLSHWPVPLQPYRHLYLELAALLPQAIPSLDDQVNAVRIAEFRRRVRILLNERIDLAEIHQVDTRRDVEVYSDSANTFLAYASS
jgi:hypothetical protein